MSRRSKFVLCVGVLVTIAFSASAARAGEWKWELTPYLWALDVNLEATVNDTDIAVDAPFSDLVNKLDIGALVHFEGRKGQGGFFAELNYFELSDDSSRSVPAGQIKTDTELDQLIAEAGGLYQILGDESGGLDLLFGGRLVEITVDLDFDLPVDPDQTRSVDGSLVDVFAGLRYRGALSERWVWSIRGDVGTGDTDLSWQGNVAFGVNLGKQRDNTLFLAYRHLVLELEDEGITSDMSVEYTGPMVGFRFGF